MSFPNMTGPQGGAWMGHPPHGHPTPPPQPPQAEENGLQTRPMGLKVQYTFDKDQQNCLARWPLTLHIQTIPIDDRNSIGIIDLRTCLQAIAQCSPEIINQPDKDYAVYALDYSEEDVPLVGQGMLSWGLELPSLSSEQKLVTGRVTKNMLAALRGGVAETLDVRLKLNAVPRMQRPQTSHNSEMRTCGSNAPTPTPTDGNSEWSSFIQSNPALGWPTNGPSAPSPGFPPPRYGSPFQAPSPAPDARPEMYMPQPGAPTPPTTNAVPVLGPAQPTPVSFFPPVPSSQGPTPEDALAPSKPDDHAQPARPKKSKRASSKAPKKKSSATTGNPRGRPPKRRTDGGNTSAVEEATDVEEATVDGPKKKRAKTTKADWPSKAPLNSAPGSLRVAASTSGSLRTMRPAASGGNGIAGSHLQDIPRAPTPVPGQMLRPQSMPTGPGQPRRSSMAGFEGPSRFLVSETGIPGPLAPDARSPSEFASQSPYQTYTPEGESPGDIGSSPPVPRSAHSVRSSPPPSSPVLPPMPMPVSQPDSGFMSGGFDEMVEEEDLRLPLPVPATMPQPSAPKRPKPSKSKGSLMKRPASKSSHGQSRPASRGLPQPPAAAPPKPISRGLSEPVFQGPAEAMAGVNAPAKPKEMVIQREYPGPQELLPKKSIYNPPASAKAQAAKAQLKNSRAPGTTNGVANPLKRSNTEPNLQRQEMPGLPTGPATAPQPPVKSEPVEPEISSMDHVDRATIESPADASVQKLEPVAELSNQAVHEPEFQRPQPAEQPTVESPNGTVEGAQAPSPAALEMANDPEDQLLRLLAEPMSMIEHVDSELPPMETQHPTSELPQPPNSETVRPESMPPTSGSDTGALAAEELPLNLSLEEAEAAQQSKNMSRKQSIKKKLEKAVKNGEMPTFCSNCGSISTPTWRKIWTQDSDGSPDIPEYSDKPGCITAIVILQRDENGKPTKYRTVKKALGTAENSKEWTEAILCNPCGLWLSKYQTQRPESKWETDFSKIGRSRKKRTEKTSRSKKSNGQDMAPATSEAYFPTDPAGPDDQEPSPAAEGDEVMLLRATTTEPPSRERGVRSQTSGPETSFECPDRQGSTHSRGSGTAQSPITLEGDDLGKTRRLLFPSPKKDGQPKVLGEVAVNAVRTSSGTGDSKTGGKENAVMGMDMDVDVDVEMNLLSTPKISADIPDDVVGLFGTPARPSTPPPRERPAIVFKTPTRPTPSHRPITRSVSKSIRTVRSVAKSPGHALQQLQGTPTKTPRSSARRHHGGGTPRSQHLHAHFAAELDTGGLSGYMTADFGTPFSSTLNQLLSEANDFTAGSSAHGLSDFDLPLDSDNSLSGHLEGLDFGHFLTTDAVMPSSPPMLGRNSGAFGATDIDFEEAWRAFGNANMDLVDEGQDQ